MMPVVHRADDIRLQLPARPGAMAALFRAFDQQGVQLHGLAAVGDDDADADHFLVEDPDAASRAATSVGGREVARRQVIVVELGRISLSATAVLESIAGGGVGVDLLYLAANGALVVGVRDIELAETVLLDVIPDADRA